MSIITTIKELTESKKAPLVYSTKFNNYLTNMLTIGKIDRNGNEDMLIKKIIELYRTPSEISYVDTTDKEDTISFIPTSRILKLYRKSYETMDKTEFEKYITAEEDLYAVHNFIKNYNGVWNSGRVEMKIGKFIKKISELEKSTNKILSDKQIEIFVNKYKALHRSRSNPVLKLVSGAEIKHWYNQDMYAHTPEDKTRDGLGSLGKSCMRYGADYFNIYSENPEVCQLLILQAKEDTSNITGRAIVWKLNDGRTYMDRIYTHFDSDVYLFQKYAEERDWLTHLNSKKDGSGMITETFAVKLTKSDFTKFPYMDSMCYLSASNKIISTKKRLFNDISADDLILLRSTTGSHERA
jgi:hypothetical protein